MKRATSGFFLLAAFLILTRRGSAQQVTVTYDPQDFNVTVSSHADVSGNRTVDVSAVRVDTSPFCWKISEVELRFDGKRVDSSLLRSGAGLCNFDLHLKGNVIEDWRARGYCPGPGHSGAGGIHTARMEVDLVTRGVYDGFAQQRATNGDFDYPRENLLFVYTKDIATTVTCATTPPPPQDRCPKANECAGAPDDQGVVLAVVCPHQGGCRNGVCYPKDCASVCPSGMCDGDGNCMDMCTVKGHSCSGTTCEEGQCVLNPGCGGVVCPAGRICLKGACVIEDDCVGVICGAGRVCFRGRCVDDPCAGMTCPTGRVCLNGGCVIPEACVGVECVRGQICVDGRCLIPLPVNPCQGKICPKGTVCHLGNCEPVH